MFANRGNMRIAIRIGERSFIYVRSVDRRLCAKQKPFTHDLAFVFAEVSGACWAPFFEYRLDLLNDPELEFRFFVAGFGGACGLVLTLFYAREISECKLYLDGFNITHRIHRTFDVDDIFVLKTADYLDHGVSLAEVREKL